MEPGWVQTLLIITAVIITQRMSYKALRKHEDESIQRAVQQLKPVSRQKNMGVSRYAGVRLDMDPRARTTQRDADDLPRTGRQSRVTNIRRMGGDNAPGINDHGRLPNRERSPATQVGEDSGQTPE